MNAAHEKGTRLRIVGHVLDQKILLGEGEGGHAVTDGRLEVFRVDRFSVLANGGRDGSGRRASAEVANKRLDARERVIAPSLRRANRAVKPTAL